MTTTGPSAPRRRRRASRRLASDATFRSSLAASGDAPAVEKLLGGRADAPIVGPADVFASVSSYVWGRDAHDGEVYTVGATWYFDFRK